MSKKGSFFRKKNKNSEKIKMKKSTIIIIEVAIAIAVFGALLGVKYLITNKAKNNTVLLENQVVNNISFTDFSILYEDGKSNIKVSMINYTQENININNLLIKLYAKDNTKVSEITANFNIDGVSMTIGPNQETIVENEVELNLTNVAKVEYIVQ